jgi:hypothetical protein
MSTGCDVYDAIDGMEIGRESSVVLFGSEDQFGKALDCVRWVFREPCPEVLSYGGEEGEDLGREGARRYVDSCNRGSILFIRGLRGAGGIWARCAGN